MKSKKKLFGMMAASLMLLFGSCTSELESLSDNPVGPESYGTVRFKLGGSAGGVQTRASEGDEIQSADEKKVTSLLAVVFTPNNWTAPSGNTHTVTEDDRDTFLKVVDVPLGESDTMVENNEYIFKIGQSGNFHVCFVANADDDLKGKIEALTTSSTMTDFKSLVVTQTPDKKPMLMTSDFYGVSVGGQSADIGTVKLIRAMARVDVVNKADDITITKLVLDNQVVKSRLMSDNVSNTPEESDWFKSPDFVTNLAGSSAVENDNNTYKEKIYSYEQFETEAGKVPSLEVYYQIDGETSTTYTHTVKFEQSGSEQTTPIPLKRNTLYRVILTNENAKLKFTLTVADWNEGEEFVVSEDEILAGLESGPDYSAAAVGDIMLKDGSLVKPDALSDTDKQNAIGVVAYKFTDGQAAKLTTIRGALGREPVGLVMALKNAKLNGKSEIQWSTNTSTAVNTPNTNLQNVYTTYTDGLTLTKGVLAKQDDTTYPAFAAVKKYRDDNKVEGSVTEWYLPSQAEWLDMLATGGIGDNADVKNLQSSSGFTAGGSTTSNAVKDKLNKALSVVGSDNYDVFKDASNSQSGSTAAGTPYETIYWSSSEFTTDRAYHVHFYTSRLSFNGNGKSSNAFRVRCVLAF